MVFSLRRYVAACAAAAALFLPSFIRSPSPQPEYAPPEMSCKQWACMTHSPSSVASGEVADTRRDASGLPFRATTAAPSGILARLAEEAQRNAGKKHEDRYDEVWSLVSGNFLYRDRLQEWPSWRHKFDGALRTPEDLDHAVNEMLDTLHDEYTFYRNEKATGERKQEQDEKHIVESKIVQAGRNTVGYLHIRTFNSKHCVDETRSALLKFSTVDSLVLDLRDNWGGRIDDTFKVFSMLVDKGPFVRMAGKCNFDDYAEEMFLDGNSAVTVLDGNRMEQPREANLAGMKPLVVLVNNQTKSAAEMLAGALRDCNRAQLLGVRTFGKGIVQRIWEFDNCTSVKITSARFYLPNGDAIQGLGITPAKLVSTIGQEDFQLKNALKLLNKVAHRRTAYGNAARTGTAYLSSAVRANSMAPFGLQAKAATIKP